MLQRKYEIWNNVNKEILYSLYLLLIVRADNIANSFSFFYSNVKSLTSFSNNNQLAS